MTGLLAESYEICELEAQNPLPMAAVNIGVAHLNRWNFLQHSEEPAGRMKSLGGPGV